MNFIFSSEYFQIVITKEGLTGNVNTNRDIVSQSSSVVDISGLRTKLDILQIHEITTNQFPAMTVISEKTKIIPNCTPQALILSN